MRIVICGGPKTGKTTLSMTLDLPARHADDYISLGWSEASAAVSGLFDFPGPWVIEGVSVCRALRKWLNSHPTGKPCDRVILLTEVKSPVSEYTQKHEAMAKGVMTVFEEIEPELRSRGVEIVRQ